MNGRFFDSGEYGKEKKKSLGPETSHFPGGGGPRDQRHRGGPKCVEREVLGAMGRQKNEAVRKCDGGKKTRTKKHRATN